MSEVTRLLPLLLALGCTPAAPPTVASELGWLVGTWQDRDGASVTEEAWVAQPHGGLLGSGRVMVSGMLGFSETLSIERVDGALTYTAWPVGQRPVRFTAERVEPAAVTFENPDHDFPRTITYARTAEGLDVTAVGEADGAPREERWSLTPAP